MSFDHSTLDRITAPVKPSTTVAPLVEPITTDDRARVRRKDRLVSPRVIGPVAPSTVPRETSDDPTGLLAAFLKLQVTLDGMQQHLDDAQRANQLLLNRLQHNTPVKVAIVANVVAAAVANTADWIDLGGPTEGYWWDLESCSVGGTDINVTAAATFIGLYVAGTNPKGLSGKVSPGLGALVDNATALPKSGFYGTRDVVLVAGDKLFIGIYGATLNQTYVANAVYTQFNVAAAEGRTSNVTL